MENAKSEQDTILYKGACFSMHYGIPSIKKILKEAKQNKNFIYKRGKRIIKFMPPHKKRKQARKNNSGKNYDSRFLYPKKLSFKRSGEKQTFSQS